MEKIEFYQRSAVIENIIVIDIFSNFSNKCQYFDLVVCFEKIINF